MARRIGEKDAIGILRGAVIPPSIGLYDDAYPVRCCGGILLIKPDAVARSTDLLPGMGLDQLARKAVLGAASDIAVKGGRPRWYTSSVMMPPEEATEENFTAIREGFARAAAEYGLELVAGDTGSARELVIDITAMGTAERFVGRMGGAEGDRVFAAGWGFGYTWLGYRVLLLGERPEVEDRYVEAALRHLYEPRVPLRFDERAAEIINAAMDSSDGLATTLYELAELNMLDVELEDLPLDPDLEAALSNAGLDPLEAVLYGGEEYGAVGFVSERAIDQLKEVAEQERIPFWIIGKTRRSEGSANVTFKGRKLARRGWTHF
ncbi:thiamine-phosphate kinase [Conexivisphaera calida]|uniref:Thiamine-monophosphate kinase n=1 Tax=Conexivisphaera calida TaxID=1874277 RepID=A0A4P2VDG8_9ARCH|nr:thiamine-phosphate kinase [Conexivisphaera calida]BBE41433.1 Thiamine-monophosphate kinase [Conexivisphaera calida]